MKPIAIFRHLACEGPGYLSTVLERHKLPFQLIRIDADDAVPDTIDDFSALVFMGGPMSVNDDLPWIAAELALIRAALDRRLPLLGHCLGGQLIAKAMGARVAPMGYREIGWHTIDVSDSDFARAWHPGLDGRFTAFHWHGERFDLPAGATRLFQSELCDNQGFFLQHTLALQFHVEMTAEMVREWAELYQDELTPGQAGIQSAAQMLDNIEQNIQRLQSLADTLYAQWLTPLLP